MTVDLARIEKNLRGRICPSCVRFTSRRTCSLPGERPCSLFSNLDKVVDNVREIYSQRIDPYVDDLRQRVCACCHFEDDHGRCPCREDLDCALNTYYPLIVEAIEDELIVQGVRRANT